MKYIMAKRWLCGLISMILFGLALLIFQSNTQSNPAKAAGTAWYVDNTATGANNGTSWANAWQSFAAIQWASVNPGDTVYISGGSAGKTYNEQLRPMYTSGTAGNPITIKIGQDAGHNGQVIISHTSYGIRLAHYYEAGWQPLEYFVVDGNYNGEPKIRVTNGGTTGISVDGNVNHIKLTYLEVDNNGSANNQHGIHIQANDYNGEILEISHCKIHDNYQDQIFCNGPTSQGTRYGRILAHDNDIYNLNDDGFESASGGIDFYNNLVHGKAFTGGTGHPDGIQFQKGYTRVWNNKFYNLSDSNSYIFIDLYNGGAPADVLNIQVYNNLVYQDNIVTGGFDALRGIAFKGEADTRSISNIVIANNTIVNLPAWCMTVTLNNLGADYVNNVRIENNILNNCFTSGGGQALLIGEGNYTIGSDTDSVDVIYDYNSIYAGPQGSSKIGYWGNRIEPYSTWVADTGAEDNGFDGDPQLLSDYTLGASSPLINSGKDLSAYFETGGSWNIGVYENVSASAPTPTPTPSYQSSDLNSDTRVNSIDFGILMSFWGSNARPKSDINQDGYVNSVDFGIMLSQWTG